MIGFMDLYVLVMLYFALRSKFINVERQEIEAEAPNNVVQLLNPIRKFASSA